MQADLGVCKGRLSEQQRLVSVAEAKATSATSNAGKAKTDLQLELGQKISDIAALKHEIAQSKERYDSAVEQHAALAASKENKQENLVSQIAELTADLTKAGIVSQVSNILVIG